MIAVLASGMTIGIAGAAVAWTDGHHPLAVLLAYALTGMIGTLGSAAYVGGVRVPDGDARH